MARPDRARLKGTAPREITVDRRRRLWGRPVSSRIAVVSLTSRTFGNTRPIRIYLPPGYDSATNVVRRYPVLYVNDGFAVFSARGWNAPRTLDRLTGGRVIPPMIVVSIDNAASIPGATTPARDRANEFLPHPDFTELASHSRAALTPVDRLGLEMALHEEAERRAMAGELALLELAWRDAEEIAAIADDMFLPASVHSALERMRTP